MIKRHHGNLETIQELNRSEKHILEKQLLDIKNKQFDEISNIYNNLLQNYNLNFKNIINFITNIKIIHLFKRLFNFSKKLLSIAIVSEIYSFYISIWKLPLDFKKQLNKPQQHIKKGAMLIIQLLYQKQTPFAHQ